MQETAPTVYESLRHFEYLNPQLRKGDIAKLLGVGRSRYSYLRSPETYHPRLSEAEAVRLSELLNQPAERVRAMYEGAAA